MPRTKSKSKSKSKKQPTPETPALSKKEQSALKRKATKEREEFIAYTSATLFGSLFLGLFLFPFGGPKVAGGAVGAIVSMALSYKYPRKALWLFLIYMPFGGTVVYMVAGGNALFQVAKDAFYIPAAIALYQECKKKRLPFLLPKGLKTPLNILLGFCIVTLLLVNGSQQFIAKRPGEQPIVMGLLGLKVLLGYLPLIACAYYLIRSKRELLFLTRLHVVLAIICCVLGLAQYNMLLTGICKSTDSFAVEGADLFKASLEAKCLVGGSLLYSTSQGVIRLPGTFVSPWHWAWFLISNACLTYATAFSDPNIFWRLGGLAGMAIVFVNAVICGQRIALILVPIVIIILLILTGQIANLKRFIPIAVGLAVVIAIGMAMFPGIVQERLDSAVARWNASPPTEFIASQAEFTSKGQEGIFGNGLGRATNSTRAFGKGKLIETYYPKLLYEIGPVGTIGFLALVTTLTVITFKIYRSVKEQNLRSFGASFWVFILIISYNTYWYPLDTDPVAIYYWFLAGVILRLPEIEQQEQEKLKAALENEPEPKKKRNLNKSRVMSHESEVEIQPS